MIVHRLRTAFFLLLMALSPLCIAVDKPTYSAMAVLSCPAITSVQKNAKNHWWASLSRPGSSSSSGRKKFIHYKWYSNDSSLAKRLQGFVGAEFVGDAEGYVVCFYQTKVVQETRSFPVSLYFEHLSLRPTSSNWARIGKKSNTFRCYNSDPAACTFIVYNPETIEDPYESLLQIKGPDSH